MRLRISTKKDQNHLFFEILLGTWKINAKKHQSEINLHWYALTRVMSKGNFRNEIFWPFWKFYMMLFISQESHLKTKNWLKMENEYHPSTNSFGFWFYFFCHKKRDAFKKDIKSAIEFTNQKRLVMKGARLVGKSRRRSFISFWDAYTWCFG